MHPLISEVAVVAKKDDKWGEVPCAFISLKDKNTKISKNEMVEFCASKLAKFKYQNIMFLRKLRKHQQEKSKSICYDKKQMKLSN